MKKAAIFGLISVLALTVSAKIITVGNYNTAKGEFATVQEAVDNATAGDTLYINGSGTNYGDVTISKKLTIIGNGFHPNKQYIQPTMLEDVYLQTPATGTTFSGIYFTNSVAAQSGNYPDSIIYSRCKINAFHFGNCNTVLVKNCHIYGKIDSRSTNSGKNILFSNCVFSGYGQLSNDFEYNPERVVFANSMFLSDDTTKTIYSSIYSSDIYQNLVFRNNIFFGISPYNQYTNNFVFENNIVYYSANTGIYENAHIRLRNNLIGVNPEFVDVPDGTTGYGYARNYNLSETSPGKGAGTDGTDIGVFGGMFPFPEDISPYQTTPMPAIPQVVEMNIQTPAIESGEPLKVKVKAVVNN